MVPDVDVSRRKVKPKMSSLLPMSIDDTDTGESEVAGWNTSAIAEDSLISAEPNGGMMYPVSSDGRPSKSLSLAELSSADRGNFYLLCFLYLLQGIPVGLAFGSVPFILKSKLSYGQIGLFSFASYPYSLKFLWSPIVDAWYNPRFGRRKSWIVPIQTTSAIVLIWLGSFMEDYIDNGEQHLAAITFFFFLLVFLCATQDIAVDGWGLTLLSQPALSYASTAQTIGLNTGYFSSFTVFLAFSSPEFANKYFRKEPLDVGLITLNQYLRLWGFIYLLGTIFVGYFKKEQRTRSDDDENSGIMSVYRTMLRVLSLGNVQSLIIVHIFAKVAFQANDAATNLKLLEKGLSKEDLALTVLIDFPFEIIFGYYAAKWSIGANPLQPWLLAFVGRMIFCLLSMFTVVMFPKDGAGLGYFLVIIVVHVLGSFLSTIQFVSINAFHTQIADPIIGGTYMTTLNTICNLGGQWPKAIVLYGIDFFTKAVCSVNDTSSSSSVNGPLGEFSCSTEATKNKCISLGGTCTVKRDGYYVMNIVCVLFGAALFFGWIKNKVQALQRLPISSWRITHGP